MNFLILTDHAGHSDQNSLYALTRTLVADERTESVFVASRSDGRNRQFFGGDLEATIYGLWATEDFTFDSSGKHYTAGAATTTYARADATWLRLPPPADVGFFNALSPPAGAEASRKWPVCINEPSGILETGSKGFLHHFTGFTAPICSLKSKADVRSFAAKFPIVLKPLEEYGGRGLVKITDGIAEEDGERKPLELWLETAEQAVEAGHYLGMKYLKNVKLGDKRILVVNGEILGASLRVPAAGEWLCNVARGGTSVPAQVSPEEKSMIEAIAPVLLAKGVVIFGADTLTDDDGRRVLSELNTNSIGGFPQAEAQTGKPILQQTINGIYNYLGSRAERPADRS